MSENNIKEWSPIHQKKFIWLFNWFKNNYDNEATKETFITKNKKELFELINKNDNWTPSSKESLYFMISRYLYNINNNDKYIKIYSQLGFNLMKQKEKIEGDNKLDKKEEDNYKSIEYLHNCLDVHKIKADDNINDHYKHLLLIMLIKQPPLRTSFYSSVKLLKLLKNDNKKDNYIYINKKGHIYYIINFDKASNYKLFKTNNELNKIKVENEELINYINYSFSKYPRLFLFEINGKPLTDASLLKYLRDITQTSLINFDMIRSVYITHFYSNNKSFNAKEKLSKDMRHSQRTASKNYFKNIEPIKKEDEIINLNKTIIELKEKLINYEPDKTKYNKRRNDILFLLNKKGKTSKPTTLNKYKIIYDEAKNIYY